MTAILTTPIDYMLSQLYSYVFGNWTMIAGFLIIAAIVMCMVNGLDLTSTALVVTPLFIGMMMVNWSPMIYWSIIILMACILWIVVAFAIAGISKS